MRRLAILLTTLLLASCEVAVPVGTDAVEATNGAEKFVVLLDNGQFDETWNLADPMLQETVTKSAWVTEASNFRKAYGKLRHRKFKDVFLGQIRGQLSGEYATVIFETRFSSDSVEEKVNLHKFGGEWMIVGYTGDPIERADGT